MNNNVADTHSHYQFIIDGHLSSDLWREWFDGLSVTCTPDGRTTLSGVIRDQAELHGVLKKISNLGLTLISVNPHQPT
jgi:hypothetical protein